MKAIPLNANASNTVVHPFPSPLYGSAKALGKCRIANHMRIIVPDSVATKRALFPYMITRNGNGSADHIRPVGASRNP